MFKNHFKKLTSLILVCIMLMGILPLGVSAINTDQVTASMTNLKNTVFPDGWYWCGGDPSKAIPSSGCGSRYNCMCNNFNYSYQCHGFALYVANLVTGSYPAVRLAGYKNGLVSGSWKCYTVSGIGKTALCGLGLRPGDIIRAASGADYADGHTVIVWKVEGTTVYFAEAWGSVYSKINWGGFNAEFTSMEQICNAYTYVALWRNNAITPGTGECPHSYKEGVETAHPHRKYTACIYCQKTEYTGKFEVLSDCVCCSGIHSYELSNEEMHPHKQIRTCSSCGQFDYTGNTTVIPACSLCQGLPYDLNAGFEKDICNIGETVSLAFSGENTVRLKAVIRKDGIKYTEYDCPVGTSISFVPHEVGNYIATVTAYSEEGKSASVTTAPLSVRAPITSVAIDDSRYYITYGLSLAYEDALTFSESRGLILTEYTDNGFTAFFDAVEGLKSEYKEESIYTYFPLPLSYYEAADFARHTDGVLASAEDAETEQLLVKLCQRTDSDGIITGSSDAAEEGVWISEEGEVLSYFNWNLSYTGEYDRYKSCLFMFPGGSFTDSYVLPGDYHGFVVKSQSDFEYTDNGDETLTLIRVAAIESSALSIPAEHKGMPVTAIGASAFANGVYGEIYIPPSVIHIEPGVFADVNIGSILVDRDSEIHRLLIEYNIDEEIDIRFRFPFTDVAQSAWYYEGIDYCYQSSYISGTSATTFSPNSNVTREQFVMMLANIAGADLTAYADAETGMSDVPMGRWYSSAVAWAVSEGYVSGVGEGVFGLGQNITREQLARLIFLYTEKQGGDIQARADLTVYTDEAAVSSWAYDNVSWAVAKGLISGMSATTLGARSTATRAQAARIFMLFDSME
ncbi:MAG: S-layer homology domain-containing protein [Clostridia bacterium]|nr:S-layer homology domain-containing protein [Clostridia bacterium]